MKLNVKATHFELTESISNYLDKKLAPLSKLIENEMAAICGVELALDKHHSTGEVFRAEITVEAPSQGFFRVSAEGETVYSAIDGAEALLLEEVRRGKRKRVHILRRSGHLLKEFTRDLGSRGLEGARGLWGKLRRKG